MSRRSPILDIDEFRVAVTRKRIKHLYVKVSRADGAVRVSAPLRADDRVVRDAVTAKLAWIRRKRQAFAARPTPAEPRFEDGECVPAWGVTRRLRVREAPGRHGVAADGCEDLVLHVRRGATVRQRGELVDAWYRTELEARIPLLVARWEPVLGRRVAEWRVRKMKTRWGSCNPAARRIWLGLELAKKPPECLEYVLVHEMAHLIEANHSERFYALMDRFLPDWRERKRLLESA